MVFFQILHRFDWRDYILSIEEEKNDPTRNRIGERSLRLDFFQ